MSSQGKLGFDQGAGSTFEGGGKPIYMQPLAPVHRRVGLTKASLDARKGKRRAANRRAKTARRAARR